MKLGIAGQLTRYFIASPLTPLFLLCAFMVGLVALVTLPREEDRRYPCHGGYHVRADAWKPKMRGTGDRSAQTIIKNIHGVKAVYPQTKKNAPMSTARFFCGPNFETPNPAGPKKNPPPKKTEFGGDSPTPLLGARHLQNGHFFSPPVPKKGKPPKRGPPKPFTPGGPPKPGGSSPHAVRKWRGAFFFGGTPPGKKNK